MNELPVIGSLFIHKGFWARGQTLQIAVRKRTAETFFDVQKTILEKDQCFFSTQFYPKLIWAMLIRSKCKFLFE